MQLSGVLVGFQFSLYRLRLCSVHRLILVLFCKAAAERAEGDQERGGQRYRSVVDESDDEAQEKHSSN